MLDIFNKLQPFFEDAYREISVREYGRMRKISPPTASQTLGLLEEEGLLLKDRQGIYLFFRANRESALFSDLAKAYWRQRIKRAAQELHRELTYPELILFGSIAKVENTKDSDIDIYVDNMRKEVDISKIEKALRRKVQLHFKESQKNKTLWANIQNGIKVW